MTKLAGSSETLVCIYLITRHHIPEAHNPKKPGVIRRMKISKAAAFEAESDAALPVCGCRLILNETKCCNAAGRFTWQHLDLRAIVEWRSNCALSSLPEDLASCHGHSMLRNGCKSRLRGHWSINCLDALHRAKHEPNGALPLLELVQKMQGKYWRKLKWKLGGDLQKTYGNDEFLNTYPSCSDSRFAVSSFLESQKKQLAIYTAKVKFSLFTSWKHIRRTEASHH